MAGGARPHRAVSRQSGRFMIDAALTELLDSLEQREEVLLSWGVVDGGFSEDELTAVVQAWLDRYDPLCDPWEIIDRLEAAGLLYEDRAISPSRWRTRSAETIRLIARLRQLFDRPGAGPDAWRNGPTLVSDFRYRRRPRAYPRRDQPLDTATDRLEGPDADLQRSVLRTLTAKAGGPMRLAGFQVRAISQVLADLQANLSRGVVIGAGTGGGKTLAFYLPALAHVSAYADGTTWTKVLALYPRNELLKDQLAETFRQVRKLDELLKARGGRKLRIGAYYGATPYAADTLGQHWFKGSWPRQGSDYVCPYLTCQQTRPDGVLCTGNLVWHHQDRRAGHERLLCHRCGHPVEGDEFALTRDGMVRQSPDIVFTTTEMLNRSMSDLKAGKVFGIDAQRPPHLMLLDEIHTYAGTTGAQTAMLLRRWRHRIGQAPVEFVGLSATLRDAGRFFADLAGLPVEDVTYLKPEMGELTYEGAEYLLALRSDPVSGVSTLSTTIQTTMLLNRCLDPWDRPVSGGLYGKRVFVFTDDLDVTNRLYYDLLDAEAQRLDSRGGPLNISGRESLATLRNPVDDASRARQLAGQSWNLPAQIGHRLSRGERLRIGRTSSQDMGVDSQAQAIVATSSLEVGFNDPTVGAVLQHKAPRDTAQFLQRKGRAGRPLRMRPWTVLVLSDYGRDRDAYQAWDLLFDPQLPSRCLPLRNRYVLRMHATQALLDWITVRLRPHLREASLWNILKEPARGQKAARWQQAVADQLERVLEEHSVRADLTRWIAQALGVDQAEATELLWHPPRAVLLEAVPTLLRRLRTQWAVAGPDGLADGKDNRGNGPLPDYISQSLFSELELPEIMVHVPAQASWRQDEQQPMAATPALRQYAPGRVSRRFATANVYHRHWVPIPDIGGAQQQELDVATAYPQRAKVACALVSGGQAYDVMRPYEIRTELVPEDVADSANASLDWRTQFVDRGAPYTLDLPAGQGWGELLCSAEFRMHARQAHIEARRFAIAAEAEARCRDGSESRHIIRFVCQQGGRHQQVGVGTVTDVDGLRFVVNLPGDVPQLDPRRDPVGHRALRSAWFQQRMRRDEVLRRYCNVFQAGWLHDALLASLTTRAVADRSSLQDAFALVRNDLEHHLLAVLAVLFQRMDITGEGDGTTAPARLEQRIRGLLGQSEVREALTRLVALLWEPLEEACHDWVRRRGLATLGGALLAAARRTCPEHDPEGLLVDIEPGVTEDGQDRLEEIWLTETTIGGGGFLEALAQRMSTDPRHFLRITCAALAPGDAEIVDHELVRVVDLLAEGGDLAATFERYRKAARNDQREPALAEIRAAMSAEGIRATHAVVSAAAARLLRPGTGPATDQVTRDLVHRWRDEEERLGVELDVRTWTYLASDSEDLDRALAEVLPDAVGDRRQWRMDAIASVLWPRGWRVRAAALSSWNPYAELPPPMPEWLRTHLASGSVAVDATRPDALEQIRACLIQDGTLQVSAPLDQARRLSELLCHLVTSPIELEYLQVHPRLAEVIQQDRHLLATIELREVL